MLDRPTFFFCNVAYVTLLYTHDVRVRWLLGPSFNAREKMLHGRFETFWTYTRAHVYAVGSPKVAIVVKKSIPYVAFGGIPTQQSS